MTILMFMVIVVIIVAEPISGLIYCVIAAISFVLVHYSFFFAPMMSMVVRSVI